MILRLLKQMSLDEDSVEVQTVEVYFGSQNCLSYQNDFFDPYNK